jgi:hypothetical protein
MLKRIPVAVLAGAFFALFGSATMLGTAVPASADPQDRHAGPAQPHHRGPNPFGAYGYWSQGAWHKRPHPAHPLHPLHPVHPKHPIHPDRDRH